jgi:hypothetical protein
MPELGPYGSVRGARGNSRPYRERHLLRLSSSQFDPEETFGLRSINFSKCRRLPLPLLLVSRWEHFSDPYVALT